MKLETGARFLKDYFTAITGRGEAKRDREQRIRDLQKAAEGNIPFNIELYARDKEAKREGEAFDSYSIPIRYIEGKIKASSMQELSQLQGKTQRK